MLVRSAGERIAAKEMRKHVAWYIKGLPHSARVREQVNRTRSAAEMVELMHLYLDELAANGMESFAPEPSEAAIGGLRASG
jgi:tRNA-dihydrouridine synthase